jgi:solute:Na+ symporter, SSS family
MQNGTLLFFIGLYLLGTLALGWWASRKVHTTADFVIAGKRLPMFVAACALFATWFGSETVMGASSEFAQHGVLGIIEDPFGAALCLFLAGLLVARPLYNLNLLTFSDYFRMRFGKKAEITSAFFMIPSYFGWIAAQLVALSVVLQVVCGLEREWGVLLCTILVVVYTYLGGMWSVAITDFAQTIAIIVGLLVLAVSLVIQVGGFDKMIAAAPPNFFRFFPENKPLPIIEWVAAWMTIGLGSIPQQDIFQRVMAAKSEETSVRACYTSSLMYLSVAFLPLLICYCGRMLYPELLEKDPQMLIPSMVLQHSGIGMQILFFGALLSAILSTCSGALLAPATVLGENLIKPLYAHLTDAQLLRIMRWSVVGVAAVTCVMAMMRDNIYELVGESSALSLVSLFVPLLGGLYWKPANSTGAIASMVVGMAVWLITLNGLPKVLEHAQEGSTLHTWASVPPMLYGFGASILAMWIGSKKRGSATTALPQP